MRVVALHSLKGGVGKTSAAVNLAWESACSGQRTLLWDLDPQGAAGWCLGVDAAPGLKPGKLARGELALGRCVQRTAWEGLHVLPGDMGLRNLDHALAKAGDSRKRLKQLAEPFAEDYAVLVLDCPPGLSRLAENVLRLADEVLVPVLPSPLSARAWAQLADHAAGVKKAPRLRAFFSLVDRRRRLHREWLEQPPAGLSGHTLRFWVPNASAVERMTVERRPLGAFDPRSPATHAYRGLWREFDSRRR